LLVVDLTFMLIDTLMHLSDEYLDGNGTEWNGMEWNGERRHVVPCGYKNGI